MSGGQGRQLTIRPIQPCQRPVRSARMMRRPRRGSRQRVRTTDGSTDLILLLEFQGRPERHMALRTTIYSCLAAQSLIRRDKELGRGDRELAVVALVLHHGDRRWNAATRLSDLFRDSAPDTYREVGRLLPDAQATDPLDLPQIVIGLSGVKTAAQMRAALKVVLPLVEAFGNEDFDRLCDRPDRKDNSPAYRDEQRAWYDTLRDLIPLSHGSRPRWGCGRSLSPDW